MSSLITPREQYLNQRVYQQTLRQGHYINLPYTILCVYKFALTNSSNIPKFKSMHWLTFTLNKKFNKRYQVFAHFLFNWFNKQFLTTSWHSTAQHWYGYPSNTFQNSVWFYLLRYNFLPRMTVYPFVPTTVWGNLKPRQTALLNYTNLLTSTDLPLPMEDYLSLELENLYRLGFQIKCELPNTLPAHYTKTFVLRSQHYPVVYDHKQLGVLQALSLVPLKTVFLFDELATARFSMDTRKKRLLMVFKALLKLGRKRVLLTEYALQYRVREQLFMPEGVASAAANFFQNKWYSYFNR